MQKQHTTTPANVTAADLIVVPFQGPKSYGEGYAAAYRATMQWVRKTNGQPLVRKTEEKALEAALAALGISAEAPASSEPTEETTVGPEQPEVATCPTHNTEHWADEGCHLCAQEVSEAATPASGEPTPAATAAPKLSRNDREMLAMFADGQERMSHHLSSAQWAHAQKMVKRGLLTWELRSVEGKRRAVWALHPAYAALAAQCAAEALQADA